MVLRATSVKINLGAAKNILVGYVNCDIRPGPGIDRVFDAQETWPFDDESVNYIYASHVLEHMADWPKAVREAHRVLQVNEIFEVKVPYGSVSWHNPDPFHKAWFVPQSFDYFLRGNDGNTTLETDWEKPLFGLEKVEVIRIFWQRERLGKILGKWIEKRYTRPRIGIPVEIHFLLRRV